MYDEQFFKLFLIKHNVIYKNTKHQICITTTQQLVICYLKYDILKTTDFTGFVQTHQLISDRNALVLWTQNISS